MITVAIIGIIATACFGKLFKFATMKGQVFGFWQKVLNWLDENGHTWAAKPLGLCDMCFCHLLALISFVIYVLYIQDSVSHRWYWWVIQYLTYVPICAVVSLSVLRNEFARAPKQDKGTVPKSSRNGIIRDSNTSR